MTTLLFQFCFYIGKRHGLNFYIAGIQGSRTRNNIYRNCAFHYKKIQNYKSNNNDADNQQNNFYSFFHKIDIQKLFSEFMIKKFGN